MVPCYIGLGSNLGRSQELLESAMAALAAVDGIESVRCSPLYRSRPQGPSDQPDYLNAVAELVTTLKPHGLLKELQAIESAHGRVRDGQIWGPRTLDLDLLLYGDHVIDTPDLVVPHPRMADRDFVLRPLLDLAPGVVIPGRGSVGALLAGASSHIRTGIEH
ncbi:MAG: 2-amino-4-hydroxy-6-hydroxymethyldihydropteridine diphosphokinase [Chromatiales bacterium]|nr:2-amino-4-hydroxy-6-hydroxymethyldihydropteridine diphosphokinase [Chromatiales bacterium]